MKKYSEKFLKNTNVLSKARIGFEFELYMKDLSYYKTLELLNSYLAPVKVWGFRDYHSSFVPDSKNFKIEPDMSLGANGCEIITGPLEYFEAKYYLNKILKFIDDYGYTTEKTAIHYNISFVEDSGKNLRELNILKMILNIDEEEIYRAYPTRANNVYAKSIKRVVPYKQYDFSNIHIGVVKNAIKLPNDKYYGINFQHINNPIDSQRLEFRYIGGKDYQKNPGKIQYFMDKFIINSYDSIDVGFDNKDMKILSGYLHDNISMFKNFSKYDNFLAEYPTITLQVNQDNNYDVVNAYYSKMFNSLFNLIDSTVNLKECIINYDISRKRLEVVDANIKATSNIKNVDFIGCMLRDGIFESCTILESSVTNCQFTKSTIDNCDISRSKVMDSYCNDSTLNDSFFMNGYFNSEMIGGVFRSGKMGPYAIISSTTKVVTGNKSFFSSNLDGDMINLVDKDFDISDKNK